MSNIIEGLLELSSIERNSLKIREVNMQDLVEDILGEFKTNCKFEIQELPTIKADTRLMRQVLVNLISNAIKYTSEIAQAKVVISSHNNETKNKVIFEIKDNGIGFEEKQGQKLFQLFGKLHVQKSGLGIGLVIVKKIIEKHNGHVWANSKTNEGATFGFELPS
jgi:signal transduction histidine kinase